LKPNQSSHSAPPSLLLSSRHWEAPHFLVFSLEPAEKNTDAVPLILNLQRRLLPFCFPQQQQQQPRQPLLFFIFYPPALAATHTDSSLLQPLTEIKWTERRGERR
jgi:hypothetical protein